MRVTMLYLCVNTECEMGTFPITGERKRVGVLCPTCHGTAAYFCAESAMTRAEWDHVVSTTGKPHGQWLEVVDRITRRWLVAEIAYAGPDVGNTDQAFADINTERRTHGLRPLTWEDVSDEAAKI